MAHFSVYRAGKRTQMRVYRIRALAAHTDHHAVRTGQELRLAMYHNDSYRCMRRSEAPSVCACGRMTSAEVHVHSPYSRPRLRHEATEAPDSVPRNSPLSRHAVPIQAGRVYAASPL